MAFAAVFAFAALLAGLPLWLVQRRASRSRPPAAPERRP